MPEHSNNSHRIALKTTPKTLIAFDFGTKHIGVAVGQQITCSARPLATVRAKNGEPDWPAITRIINTWQPDAIVIGIPLTMDDKEQEMTHAARRFANRINGRYHLPVIETDERLSSMAAEQIMYEENGGRKIADNDTRIHQISAQLILETYYTQQRNTAT